ncbi:hypothetical protein [Compostimonas suwonensis]|uniref:Uncharacterized protein n=1 Tax=Compostimonas suwonensis TaxID=1048394 RepID=A0A2M9BVP7_9MICO|nr:hypothetical protein [Compostimonas suwonensis]PJJ62026.1 hypothetical protein CLV54_1818 [Compostimonas suwonensis]
MAILLVIVFYVIVPAVVLWVLYLIIKTAVKNALRDHQTWLDTRIRP